MLTIQRLDRPEPIDRTKSGSGVGAICELAMKYGVLLRNSQQTGNGACRGGASYYG
jgi:hypothetical protein